MYQKLLITGQMRSGTTLLCNFLNSHEHTTMYADIFHTVAGRVPDPKGWSFATINYLADLSQTKRYYFLYSISHGIDVLKTANEVNYKLDIDVHSFKNVKELYDLLLDSIACDGDRVVGNKVTSCELNISNLLTQTDLKVLYIHRDARDVVVSAAKKFNQPLDGYIQAWNRGIDTVLGIQSPNLLCVKFEDLVCRKAGLKEQLDDFLDMSVNFDIEQLSAYDRQWVANSSFNDVNSPFDASVACRWKNAPTWDVEKVYSFCKDRLAALGYDPM